jgi:hypothetical protein
VDAQLEQIRFGDGPLKAESVEVQSGETKMQLTPHPPMPPCCDFVRSDKGEPSFLAGPPLLPLGRISTGDWVKWSQMCPDFRAYALARIRAAWLDGPLEYQSIAADWLKWSQDNQP